MKRFPLATGLIALALLAAGLLSNGLLAQAPVTAASECPASWPQESHDGFFTDAAGQEWFIIRSTDSNGYATVRAYPASDAYPSGYAADSPDRVCYLLVRQPGEPDDADEPRQLQFPKEREPQPTPQPPTLQELLDRLSPAEQQAALLCLLPLAGNRTLEELNSDPDFIRLAIERGCLTP